MDRCYLISRYRADNAAELDFNVAIAKHYCKEIVEDGYIPVAPHLFFTQFLDDNFPADRATGTLMGIEELKKCQRFLLVIVDGVISEGMQRELQEVSRLGIPGRFISLSHKIYSQILEVAANEHKHD